MTTLAHALSAVSSSPGVARPRRYLMCPPTHFAVEYAIDAWIAYHPAAFSAGTQAAPARLFPDAVPADAADAQVLGLNADSDGRNVVLPHAASGLAARLADRGYRPVPVDLSELLEAGGGPRAAR